MNGVELAREVQDRWPGIKVLLTSGYAEGDALSQLKQLSGVRLLTKPYKTIVLDQVIRKTLGRQAAGQSLT